MFKVPLQEHQPSVIIALVFSIEPSPILLFKVTTDRSELLLCAIHLMLYRRVSAFAFVVGVPADQQRFLPEPKQDLVIGFLPGDGLQLAVCLRKQVLLNRLQVEVVLVGLQVTVKFCFHDVAAVIYICLSSLRRHL